MLMLYYNLRLKIEPVNLSVHSVFDLIHVFVTHSMRLTALPQLLLRQVDFVALEPID